MKTWMDKYKLAKNFYEKNNHIKVPAKFKTSNGVDYDENGFVLSKWIRNQRRIFDGKIRGNLNDEQVELLKAIGVKLGTKTVYSWDEKYELAKAYYMTYGNLDIPRNFKTVNGIDYDSNGISLGEWLLNQKRKYNGSLSAKLTEKQIELLNEIGMNFENKKYHEVKWNTKYQLAKIYYEKYGNLNISRDFKTSNGIDYDENGINLGLWVYSQKINYNNSQYINEERINLLKKIGIDFTLKKVNMDIWETKYQLAKVYYETYGNLNIPYKFKTSNGKDYDEFGIALGIWIVNQRQAYQGNSIHKISKERIELLTKIGMDFSVVKQHAWNEYYALAIIYFNTYGNLEVPQKFKTSNGIDYDENGLSLGNWISNQRGAYKGRNTMSITKEQIELLSCIGMRWNNLKPRNKKK